MWIEDSFYIKCRMYKISSKFFFVFVNLFLFFSPLPVRPTLVSGKVMLPGHQCTPHRRNGPPACGKGETMTYPNIWFPNSSQNV